MLYHTPMPPCSDAAVSWFLVLCSHCTLQSLTLLKVLNGGAAHEFQWHTVLTCETPILQSVMSDGLETLNPLYITHLH